VLPTPHHEIIMFIFAGMVASKQFRQIAFITDKCCPNFFTNTNLVNIFGTVSGVTKITNFANNM
jgi:hypothetical protein